MGRFAPNRHGLHLHIRVEAALTKQKDNQQTELELYKYIILYTTHYDRKKIIYKYYITKLFTRKGHSTLLLYAYE
jgi:hypothetical protein